MLGEEVGERGVSVVTEGGRMCGIGRSDGTDLVYRHRTGREKKYTQNFDSK
jgi:hypothetical protein